MTYPAYPAYKDSGVAWLGDVPLHWDITRLKHCIEKLVGGGTPDSNNELNWADEAGEGTFWVTIADMTRSAEVTTTTKRVTAKGISEKGLVLLSVLCGLGMMW